jgi:histone-arginine methyltransferase CARM1
MFPPTSLLSPACAPREFDFYTASIDELLDFEIPVDFVVARTGLIHGVRALLISLLLPLGMCSG